MNETPICFPMALFWGEFHHIWSPGLPKKLSLTESESTLLCLVQISRCLNYALPSSTINCHRQSWDISNFIGRDQKVALYHLVFWGNDTKKSFLTNWGWGNNTQGVHEHSKFCKNVTVCWVRLLTMNKYSLWIVRVNKRFKKHFCGTHPF